MLKKIKWIKIIFILCVVIGGFFVGGYFTFYYTHMPLPLHRSDNASTFVRRDGKKLLLFKEGIWEELIVSGVTLEDSIPGKKSDKNHITYDMYMKWFSMIDKMNANIIQAHDLMGVEFYRALYDYNRNHEEPLYLMQVITLKDQTFDNMIDAFSGNLEKLLTHKAYSTIDAVHGSTKGGKNPYIWDVSDWTLAYILGTDWDQDLVIYTNDFFDNRAGYSGKYITTWPTASAFEKVLAKVGDHIFSYETGKYGQQRLLAYKNWTRTDAIFHDSSWSQGLHENIGSVNMELITAEDAIKSGIFVAYHVEPSYPYFLSFDPVYSKYIDEAGNNNPYRGYLKALNEYHKLPIIVSEFGVSTSRGISNIDEVRSFHQGGMNEKEQGVILKTLYKDIMDAGLCGGIIHSWSDGWNKRVWNTKDAVDLDRSGYWIDAQTSTQAYGLLAVEPGEGRSVSYVDGDPSEWEHVATIAKKDGYGLQMMYDEKYIYFHVQLKDAYSLGDKVYIPLDITSKSGTKKDTTNELLYDRDMDFVIVIDGKEHSRILVQAYYNKIYPLYGIDAGKENIYMDKPNKDVGQFDVIKQLSRKAMFDEKGGIRGAVIENAGMLYYGNANPDKDNYDSMSDFMISGNHIEIRIPWALLNFSDPSKMMIHDDYYENYGVDFMQIQELYGALTIKKGSKIVQIPSGRLKLSGWGDEPKWHTRLKESYDDVQDIFRKYQYNKENK